MISYYIYSWKQPTQCSRRSWGRLHLKNLMNLTKRESCLAILARSPESPFQILVNNNNITSLSHSGTLSFLCLPPLLRLQGLHKCSWQTKLKITGIQKRMYLTRERQNRFMFEGPCQRQWSQVETSCTLWPLGCTTHFLHTTLPLKHTHTHTHAP